MCEDGSGGYGVIASVLVEELVAGPRDSGTDGPHRDPGNGGGLLVGESDELGEYEGFAPFVIERRQEVIDLEPMGVAVAIIGCRRDEAVGQAAQAGAAAGGVDTHPSGDRQDPGAGVTVAPKAVQGVERPFEGLLGQIVGVGRRSEEPAKAPHRGLGSGDEVLEGAAISCLGAQSNNGDSLHTLSEAARRASPLRANVTSCRVAGGVLSTGRPFSRRRRGNRKRDWGRPDDHGMP